MTGYFHIIPVHAPHKAATWPVGVYDPTSVVFVEDLSPFRAYFTRTKKIYQTFQQYPSLERDTILTVLDLIDDLRITGDRTRRWHELGFGVRWRATLAVGLLEGKPVISLPIGPMKVHDAPSYWLLPIVQTVWDYLLNAGKIILVSAHDAAWLAQTRYPKQQA